MKRSAALALALGLAYGFLPNALAFGLEQKGRPEASVGTLPTYGLEVPTRTALKTVIPSGWQLFVHQSVKLPAAVNWKVGDAWPQVLGSMAESSQLSVLVDWDAKTVLIRSQDVAVKERATRDEIAQAATTPLPKFEFETTAKKQEVAPAPALAAPQVYAINTKAEPQPSAAPAPSAPKSEAPAPVAVAAAPAPAPEAVVAKAVAPEQKPADSFGVPVPKDVAPALTPATAPKAEEPVRTPEGSSEQLHPRAATVLNALFGEQDKPAPVTQAPKAPASVPAIKPPPQVALAAAKPAKPVALPQVAAPQTRAQAPAPAPVAAAVRTPTREELAREAAAKVAPGAPTPYNDVMPTVSGALFDEGRSVAPAPASVPTPAIATRAQETVAAPAAAPAPAAPTVMPVIRTNPTPQMVATQEAAAARNPAKLGSTSDFSYVNATALNKPQVRRVAQGIAAKFGYRLVWSAPEVQLRGPVTLLANAAAEDLTLLKKALGPTTLRFELDDRNKYLLVTSSDPAYAGRLAQVMAEESARANAARVAQPEAVGSGAAPSAPAKVVLTVRANEPLENSLVRLLRAEGYTFEWKVSGGFEAARDMTFEGESLVQVLSQILPPLGVSADVYTRDKHIVVRPGEARDK